MRIAVLGAGAMGSWFGGLLALHGQSVQLLTTNEAHRKAIELNGLILQSPDGDQSVEIDTHAPHKIEAPIDLVLVMTKTFQTSAAIASISHAITTDTHILSLQNGLGNSETMAKFFSLERIWIGVSMTPIDKIAPGVVVSKGHGSSYFGNAANNNEQPMADIIASAFQTANIDLQHDRNIQQRIWEKVAFNAGMNALSALSNGRPGTIGRSTGAKTLAQDVAKEVATVARTQNIEIEVERVLEMIDLSCSKHGEHIPSMLQDIQSKRRTEIDALSGAVARIAATAEITAPLNTTLTTLVKLTELANQEYP